MEVRYTLIRVPDPAEFDLAICLQAAWEVALENLGTSAQGVGFFENEKASHVSSASQIDDA